MVVVGIGASAGGINALEQFFRAMPSGFGVAFLVAQHISPTFPSNMDQIIGRNCKLKTMQAAHGALIEPDSVYTIPPGQNLLVWHGRIRLEKRKEKESGWPSTVDKLFTSLAEDQGKSSVAVILSGAGSDGTAGAKAVKNAGGVVLVQDPSEAEYDGMPSSAVRNRVTDYVLPVASLPLALIDHLAQGRSRETSFGHQNADGFDTFTWDILALVRERTQHDFSRYKRSTILRRIERRMSFLNLRDPAEYLAYLEQNPRESFDLFQSFLINITDFFRDKDAYEYVERQVVPDILANKTKGEGLRVWVPACSTGEEAYSLAMLFDEATAAQGDQRSMQIFATDISPPHIQVGRLGMYAATGLHNVARERLERHFRKIGKKFQVRDEIRERLVFAVQDLIKDPPMSNMDLISCRNMLIYLDATLQKQVLASLYYGLNPGGVLLLGTSENVAGLEDLFEPISLKWRVFRARGKDRAAQLKMYAGASARIIMQQSKVTIMKNHPKATTEAAKRPRKTRASEAGIPAAEDRPRAVASLPENELREVTEREILALSPPAVLVGGQGEVLYFYGDVSPFLHHQGKASLDVLDLVQGAVRNLVLESMGEARQTGRPAWRGMPLPEGGNPDDSFKVVVAPVRGDGTKLLVSFEDKRQQNLPAEAGAVGARIRELEQSLQAAEQELNTAVEELKAANEELLSNNEELQSANEELQTSREELQSINEELEGVNTELQKKNTDLVSANNDIHNLLSSTGVATLFLDQQLHVTRFTPPCAAIFSLREQDHGRPISELVSRLLYDTLEADARSVLDHLAPLEKEVRSKDGAWYILRIRPYRTVDNYIAGIVVTVSDVTDLKISQIKTQTAQAYAEAIVDTVRDPLLVLDGNLCVKSANRRFYEFFKVDSAQTEGRMVYDLGNSQWDIPDLRRLLTEIIPNNAVFDDFNVEHAFPLIGRRRLVLNARRLDFEAGGDQLVLLSMKDVTSPGQEHKE